MTEEQLKEAVVLTFFELELLQAESGLYQLVVLCARYCISKHDLDPRSLSDVLPLCTPSGLVLKTSAQQMLLWLAAGATGGQRFRVMDSFGIELEELRKDAEITNWSIRRKS